MFAKSLFRAVLVVSCAVAAPFANASSVPRPVTSVEVIQAHAALAQLVTPQNPQALGFRSVAEAQTSTVDPPIPVFQVRLDVLRSFRPGQPAATLLTDLGSAVYLVRVGTEARSVMELGLVRGAWQQLGFGDPAGARLVDQARQTAARAAQVDLSAFFEVRIPALNLFFLGHQGPRGLMLTPLTDDAGLQFHAGQPIDAQTVFAQLQPLAAAHDGLNR